MRKQTFEFQFNATPDQVYQVLLDIDLLPQWRVPNDMEMRVHEFDASEGGSFRISLIYHDPDTPGKSAENVDTYHGYFKTLIPNQKIVEVIQFESEQMALMGDMIITTELYAEDGGTRLVATHENLPEGVPEDQNELGWKMSLGKLAELLNAA